MSKFSNFHFTATNETKKRLIKLGEEKKYFYSWLPSIDALFQEKNLNKEYFKSKYNLDLDKPFYL